MVTNRVPSFNEAEHLADIRANELIDKFQSHYEECIKAHPEHAEKKREIFEAWAIQKIAGLQLCVEHISEQFNRHLKEHVGA